VAVQTALCLVLLVAAGLLVRTVRNLESVNLGFRASGLLVFGVNPPATALIDRELIRLPDSQRYLGGRLRPACAKSERAAEKGSLAEARKLGRFCTWRRAKLTRTRRGYEFSSLCDLLGAADHSLTTLNAALAIHSLNNYRVLG